MIELRCIVSSVLPFNTALETDVAKALGRMRQPADLIFDLDGTISDPLVGIHRCINYAPTSGGFDEVPQSVVAKLIGPPLDDAFRELLPIQSDRQIARLVSKYRERYAQIGYSENTVYEGVVDALNRLFERRVTIGLCTSKRADFAERILELFGIREFFSFVDGGDIGITKAQQLEALSRAGFVGNSSTMIGDRAVDISAARANGLSSVGVLWGYGSEAELREAGAESIIENTRELSELSGAA